MKKIICIILMLLMCPVMNAFAEQPDYEVLYAKAEEANFKFMHDIDPYQDEDTFKYAWSPYLLFRTSSTLNFKSISIPPGYYLLTARKFKDRNWILFKQQGKVLYVVPALRTEVIAPDFYKRNVPQPKKSKWKKIGDGTMQGFYKVFKGSKKQDPPKSFIDMVQYEGNLYLLKYYYGQTVYITLFRVN